MYVAHCRCGRRASQGQTAAGSSRQRERSDRHRDLASARRHISSGRSAYTSIPVVGVCEIKRFAHQMIGSPARMVSGQVRRNRRRRAPGSSTESDTSRTPCPEPADPGFACSRPLAPASSAPVSPVQRAIENAQDKDICSSQASATDQKPQRTPRRAQNRAGEPDGARDRGEHRQKC